jgi:hypothetical protein
MSEEELASQAARLEAARKATHVVSFTYDDGPVQLPNLTMFHCVLHAMLRVLALVPGSIHGTLS